MIGWWVCRWSNDRDEDDCRSIEFGQIIGLHPTLSGRFVVQLMGTKDEAGKRYWHSATILRKWLDRSDARAANLAIRAVEMTAEKCIADPRSRERVRDSVIMELLTGGYI